MPALVFVSCGQATLQERSAAKKVRSWLEGKGFDVFVALETQSLSDINSGTIGHLRRADYFLFIDFPREQVVETRGKQSKRRQYRGSLFSHQELALAYLLGFPDAVFLKHRQVELRGIAQFQMANAATFTDYSEVPRIVRQLVSERAWRPDYSRHLAAVDVDRPIAPNPYESFGNERFDWEYYARIANRRNDAAAMNTIGRLVRIVGPEDQEQPVPDQSRLAWGGQQGFECTIYPGDMESLSLFAVDRDQNHRVYLHSARNIPPQHPIIVLPGVYRLSYQLVAADFPLHEFEVELNYTADIETITAKIVTS